MDQPLSLIHISNTNETENTTNSIEENTTNTTNTTNNETEQNTTQTNSNTVSIDDYFTKSKLERETMYSQMLESYENVLNSSNLSLIHIFPKSAISIIKKCICAKPSNRK